MAKATELLPSSSYGVVKDYSVVTLGRLSGGAENLDRLEALAVSNTLLPKINIKIFDVSATIAEKNKNAILIFIFFQVFSPG